MAADDTEIKPPDRCPACDWFDTTPLDGKWHYDDGTCYKCGVVWYEYRIAELTAERDGMEERVVATMVERDASVKKLAELEQLGRKANGVMDDALERLIEKDSDIATLAAGFRSRGKAASTWTTQDKDAIAAAAELCERGGRR